jgi:hypothetical protein
MKKIGKKLNPRRVFSLVLAVGFISLVLAFAFNLTGGVALASPLAATAPGLGAAGAYSALGKAGVTNSGNSVLAGNVGADDSITGFPPGIAAAQVFAPDVNGAEADALSAYGALSQTIDASLDLAGTNTVFPGTYDVSASTLNGTLTLDGSGVYIFRSTSSIIASGSMNLINGADACNVFWQIPISMSINSGANMVGTIIANTGSITFGEGASLNGRALALVGQVTLLNNRIFGPICALAPTATAGAPTATAGAPTATGVAPTDNPQPEFTPTPQTISPATGADLSEMHALATRQWIRFGIGALGIGLVLFGLTFRRKQSK